MIEMGMHGVSSGFGGADLGGVASASCSTLAPWPEIVIPPVTHVTANCGVSARAPRSQVNSHSTLIFGKQVSLVISTIASEA